MADPGGRSRRKRSEYIGRPNELGSLLADLRTAKRLSLRQVEEATGKAVSNAYLSQLENGKIHKPSPNVLHSLSGVYAVPYEALMEKAGYLLPLEDSVGGRKRRLAAFAIDDLTARVAGLESNSGKRKSSSSTWRSSARATHRHDNSILTESCR